MPGSLAAVIDARSVRTNRTMYVNVLTICIDRRRARVLSGYKVLEYSGAGVARRPPRPRGEPGGGRGRVRRQVDPKTLYQRT